MSARFKYPSAKQGDVVDVLHGVTIADPYRWLEQANTPETQAFVAAQNALSEAFIEQTPKRADIHRRLTELYNFPQVLMGWQRRNRYFFLYNDGLKNQSVLYMQIGLDGEAKPVLDPNTFSDDGTVAVTTWAFSDDGTLLAYGLSSSGSDQQQVHIRNLDTGADYPEVLKWCRFATIAWDSASSGFYYQRYPSVDSGEDTYQHCRVYWHSLGNAQAHDEHIYELPEAPELNFSPILSDDDRYLVLNVWHGAINRNRIHYVDLTANTPFIKLLDLADADYQFIGTKENLFYFTTNKNAPRGRVIAIDVQHPTELIEIIPESADIMAEVIMANHHFAVLSMRDASHRLTLYTEAGQLVHEIPLPGFCSVRNLHGRNDLHELLIGVESFLSPENLYRYDFATDQLTVFQHSGLSFDATEYETRQVFYPSKDGTRVSMFITCKKDVPLDGNNPTYLHGYGGYSVSLTPFYANWLPYWLEQGGVFAVANLRGGAEYGEDWHQAGMLDRKQNVFDDFIAAGEWLIANKYTQPSRLVIEGASNGGLLVAACLLQRPELFGAVLCEVPVIDMLRFHKFTAGRFWTPEYGNPDQPNEFTFLLQYSPYHTIKRGVTYPPTLIMTADSDDRVVPMHSFKFAAALQAADAGDNPLLLRVDVKAGHGFGKPIGKLIEDATDVMTFLRAVNVIGDTASVTT